MITNEAVNHAIDYILEHAGEELTIEEVAAYCNYSKFYFSRLFKEQTGESIYAFVKRLKLEQSAFRLKAEQNRSITDIGELYGYSSSNYSSAFRLHYHLSPIDFRRKSLRNAMEHPFFHHENWELGTFGECNRRITIEEVPDYFCIYERRFGNYHDLSRNWSEFLEAYKDYVTESTKMIERTFDDPSVTSADGCLYDICMSVDRSCSLENTCTIQGGRCIVYHFNGLAKHIYAAYQTLFCVWLPQTSYQLDECASAFDIYHVADCNTMYMELDICLPILK